MHNLILSVEENQFRVRLPKKGEVIGIVEELLGYARMKVRCMDGVERICRVPGKYLRRIWVKARDVVIVKPWEIEKEKGDIIYKYRKTDVNWLINKGYLKGY